VGIAGQSLFEGWSYAVAAEGCGVSERTVAKWVRRIREGGVAALADASSRPGAPPHQTPPRAVAIDDHSRLAYVAVLEDQGGATCPGSSARPVPACNSGIFAPGPTRRVRMVRPSASFRPSCANGRISHPTPRHASAAERSVPMWVNPTASDPTRASTIRRRGRGSRALRDEQRISLQHLGKGGLLS
jgi:hypothetical protein